MAPAPLDGRTQAGGSPGVDAESTPGERGASPHGNGQETDGRAAPARGSAESLGRLLQEMTGPVEALIQIYSDRMRLSVRRKVVQTVIGASAAIFAVFWLGAAALATFRGVRGGFTALWGGRAWIGDLTAGALTLGLAAGAGALYLRSSERRELARLKTKYEEIQHERDKQQDGPSPTQDG